MLPITPEENWLRLLSLSKRRSYNGRGEVVECVDLPEAQLAPSGLIDVYGDVHMPVEGEVYYDTKVYFGVVTGSFVSNSTISPDLEWLPKRVDKNLILHLMHATSLFGITAFVGNNCAISGPFIESLDHIPLNVGHRLNIANTNIRCLHNLHLNLPHLNAKIIKVHPYTTHLLGLSFLACDQVVIDTRHIIRILRDPFLWQEHLLELGLVKQAQL